MECSQFFLVFWSEPYIKVHSLLGIFSLLSYFLPFPGSQPFTPRSYPKRIWNSFSVSLAYSFRSFGFHDSSATRRKYTMHCLADFPMAVVAFNRRRSRHRLIQAPSPRKNHLRQCTSYLRREALAFCGASAPGSVSPFFTVSPMHPSPALSILFI